MTAFMHLPFDIRQHVYRDAGMITGATVILEPRKGVLSPYAYYSIYFQANGMHMRKYEGRDPSYYSHFTSIEDEAFQVTYRLLTVSKDISSEIKCLVCAKNTLVISNESPETGLKFLQSLAPSEVHSLQSLFVHLFVKSPLVDNGSSSLFNASLHLTVERITLWQHAARHILSHAQGSNLSLSLICDTGNNFSTSAVLSPLLEFPGRLRDCQIRLYQERNNHLSSLAQEVANRAKEIDGPGHTQEVFRFFDLPPEIRLAILLYTDLRTPSGLVYWNPQRGFYFMISLQDRHPYDKNSYHFLRSFLKCGNRESPMTGCFCRARRSAYSSRCQCWTAPRSLFLVNKQMYREALSVLYSSNRIIVMLSLAASSNGESRGPSHLRLDSSRFITRHMWPDMLRNLRNLELVLPPFDPEIPAEAPSPMYLDWCFAIDHLAAHANLRSLSLVIQVALRSNFANGDPRTEFRHYVTHDGEKSTPLLRKHISYLTPLRKLQRLKDFFVFLQWPWYFSQDPDPPIFLNMLYPHIPELELCLERYVMGQGYDNWGRGKPQKRPSGWLFEDYHELDQM
ncbi:hypothetical protein JX266_002307 [Neoarthrinium moseri]|nr:hypothetical protein JX266_002307 [Neoarthrinium moseri]